MTESMLLEGRLTWTDLLGANLLHIRPRRLARLFWTAVLSVWALLYFATFLLAIQGLYSPVIPVLGTIAIATFLLYRYLLLPRRIRRIYQQQVDLQAPFSVQITPEALLFESEVGKSRRPWSDFVKWKENDDLLLLYYSDVLFTVLPKRIFTDEAQITQVRTALHKHGVQAA